MRESERERGGRWGGGKHVWAVRERKMERVSLQGRGRDVWSATATLRRGTERERESEWGRRRGRGKDGHGFLVETGQGSLSRAATATQRFCERSNALWLTCMGVPRAISPARARSIYRQPTGLNPHGRRDDLVDRPRWNSPTYCLLSMEPEYSS